MNDLETVKNVMLGHIENKLDLVIMTPLKSTFEALIFQLNITKVYEKCFFKNGVAKYNGKKVLVVLSPQGIASKDIVELFSNTNILFFGLAGSLKPEYKIGEFFEIDKAVFDDETIELTTFNRFKKAKCGYSPCMLGNLANQYCNKAKKNGCHVVDMEIAVCAETAKIHNNIFVAFVLISDIPHIVNFWEITEKLQKKLATERKNAIKIIIEYIDIFERRKNNE